MHNNIALLVVVATILGWTTTSRGARLKDVAEVRGVRPNHLVGYGLVVGLQATGDDMMTRFSVQSVATMLKRLGTVVDPSQLRLRNVAAVVVTAKLPPFMAAGQRIDVTVSSIGSATSLQGGTLLATQLKGGDLRVYAVAQGSVSVGGYSVGGNTGSRSQKNHTTVGRVPGGAVIEREVMVDLPADVLSISLKDPDFTTAVRAAKAIDAHMRGPETPPTEGADEDGGTDTEPFAWAVSSGSVEVRIPRAYAERIPMLVAELEVLDVAPDIPTRVVINERTGTVVLGELVRLAPVAIAHGGLTIEVTEDLLPSQPPALSGGRTVVVPSSTVTAREAKGELHELRAGASLGDVVRALNAIGVSPRDLVAIMQALKTSGALQAELEVQ